MYARKADNYENDFFWLDKTDAWSISLTSNTSSGNYYGVNTLTWSVDGSVDVARSTVILNLTTIQSVNLKINGDPAGFYAIQITPLEEGSGVIKVIAADTLQLSACNITIGNGSHFAHVACPNYIKNAGSFEQFRISSLSIDYRNIAAKEFRAGEVVGFQSPAGTHYTDFFTGVVSPFSNLAALSALGSEVDEATNGNYGFYLANGASDFDMVNFTEVDVGGSVARSYLPLTQKRGYLVIAANMPQSATNIAGAGVLICDSVIEYSSLNQLVEVERPGYTAKAFGTALRVVSNVEQWHENATHAKSIWEKIRDWVGGAFNWVKENTGTLQEVVRVAAPLVKTFL